MRRSEISLADCDSGLVVPVISGVVITETGRDGTGQDNQSPSPITYARTGIKIADKTCVRANAVVDWVVTILVRALPIQR